MRSRWRQDALCPCPYQDTTPLNQPRQPRRTQLVSTLIPRAEPPDRRFGRERTAAGIGEVASLRMKSAESGEPRRNRTENPQTKSRIKRSK